MPAFIAIIVTTNHGTGGPSWSNKIRKRNRSITKSDIKLSQFISDLIFNLENLKINCKNSKRILDFRKSLIKDQQPPLFLYTNYNQIEKCIGKYLIYNSKQIVKYTWLNSPICPRFIWRNCKLYWKTLREDKNKWRIHHVLGWNSN